ncbi:MAG: CusA/CzcA family heavy metal efflux RND transporter, partial [Pseudomonadota bacterium]
ALLAFAGVVNLRTLPVDAIPDLSDVQVIVKTSYPGQAPQVVEAQVTYPLTTALLGVPGAATVRGFSFFGDSFVYIVFEDNTDLYWARSRVLEVLSQVTPRLPEAARASLGPDATGVGWVYQYALVDREGRHDLAELRALQDWFLKFELQAIDGVAEVATVGGRVRQFQVVVDPNDLGGHDLTLADLRNAIERGNRETGGSVVEMAEAEFMVRATGYVTGLDDLRAIPLRAGAGGTPLTLGDVAEVRHGPELRRGVADLDGRGEVTGGIVVMRYGENAAAVIARVRERIAELRPSLPPGVEIVPVYDRSGLIGRAVATVTSKLAQEFAVVALICALFLFHLRSALVPIVVLPLGVLAALLITRAQGLNANIMSLAGIAIAIGAMVDGAIVMVENLHKHLEADGGAGERWPRVARAAREVGAPLFVSLTIITLSFLPVFTLEAQEGRLFAPLAYTKTWAMAAAAVLSITLVPVLMGYLVRGRIRNAGDNPLNRWLRAAYRPAIAALTARPRWFVVAGVLATLSALWPASRLGSEFMPPLDEGDWMYMPTTRPGLSIGEAAQLLQQTDRLIRTVPEVAQVFGKIGRADTATDPAPLTMIETLIRFKPESEWRAGYDIAAIRAEIRRRVQLPGVSNAWVMPIRTRIDMLATGIKTPVGLKISGPDLGEIQRIGERVEALLEPLDGTASVYAERAVGGRYIVIDVDRHRAARHGMNIDDVHELVRFAVGGMNVGEVVDGLRRFPINLRYPRALRDNIDALRALPVVAPGGTGLTLGEVADIRIDDGPPVIKSENGRPTAYVFVDIEGSDVGAYVDRAGTAVAAGLDLPPGYSLKWSGQFEYLERARARLGVVVPLTIVIIALLLYLAFGGIAEALLVLATVPMALAGAFWFIWWLDYALSVAVAVGFIALAGVAAELAVLMLTYLRLYRARYAERPGAAADVLQTAVRDAALERLRPIVMTMATISIGLTPVMFGSGAGADMMQRIAAPMIGGMVSTLLLTLLVLPAMYLLWQQRRLQQAAGL